MTATLEVNVSSITVRTLPLTSKLFKQIQVTTDYDDVRHINKDRVLGWVDGSITGDDHVGWLVFRREDGTYRRYKGTRGLLGKFDQVFIN